jgi:hypothetical protein
MKCVNHSYPIYLFEILTSAKLLKQWLIIIVIIQNQLYFIE